MDIRAFLRSQHIPFEMLLHQPMPSATRLARCMHVPGGRVAKGVLVRLESGYALAVLPATHRIDLPRLAEVLGNPDARLATEDEVERIFFDCERGALPPFGRLYGLRTVVDSSLAAWSDIIVEGNMRHEGLKLRFRDFEAAEGPIRARFANATAPRQRRPHRRAG